ncbi:MULTISPECIES: hybrid sensor histidine kinase/response regulator [Sphingomonas]|uniref:hybrid sensor histidine kinase/response regulator n=1 Tax=Sphingomonas TaxID=13687 RepID=UPI0013B3DEC5|nr:MULTISPECIES: PAS domain S-box protein [Sphingomonas]
MADQDHASPASTQLAAFDVFRAFADNLPQLAWIADAEGSIYWYNQRWLDYTGTTLDQMFGWGWTTVHDPAELDRVVANWRAALAAGEPWEDTFPLRRADGTFRTFLSRANPCHGADGAITHWFGTNTDITDQLIAEERMREAQQRLAAALEASETGTFFWDMRSNALDWDEALDRLFGLPPGKTARSLDQFLAMVHPDDRAGVVERCERCVAEGADFDMEFRVIRPDGEQRWLYDRGKTVLDADGKPALLSGACVDITARRHSEEAARIGAREIEAIYQAAPVGLTVLDQHGRYVRINQRLAEINGVAADDHIGRTLRDVVPALAEAGEALFDRVLAGEEVWGLEMTGETAAQPGVQRTWRENWLPMRDDDGSIIGVTISAEEITQAKESERRLLASEERYRALFESMEQGFCVVEVTPGDDGKVDHRFIEINPAFSRQSGLPPSVIGHSIKEAVPDLEQSWSDHYAEIARTGISQRFVEHAAPLGRWFEVYAFRIGDPARRHVAILFSDVTERVRREEDLRLRLNAIPQMVWSTRPDGFHDFYNDRWYEYTGTPPGSTDGEGWNDMFHPDDQERAWARWRASLASGEPYEIEYRLRHNSGDYRWVLGRALPVRDEEGEIVRWMGTCTDVDDTVRARTALEESEATLRAVIESMPVGLMFSDATGKLTGRNQRIGDILLTEPPLTKEVGDYARDYRSFHGDGRPVENHEFPLARVVSGAEQRPELECQVTRGDGSLAWVRYVAAPIEDAGGNLVGGVVATIDIDREKRLAEGLEREVEKVVGEREAAQEALRQSQKLEAMGQLTGGVAHDFNNLLTPIIGSLDLLHRKEVGDARMQRLVDGALQSAERAKTLVQRLLAFARRQPLQPTAIDVGQIVEDMADLIASTSGPRVRVAVTVAPGLPPARADGNQLEMALLNLSVNARDAMPSGGRLNIDVRSADAPSDLPDLAGRPHIVLTVADTGLGMDEETLARCIEPFYSTKGVGKGTGLGLSMVHGLAAQLGGALRIDSREGEGTWIELWLPVSAERVGEAERTSRAAREAGQGLVLLVDDEELVRESTASMLTDLGYRVVEAKSAEQALELVKDGLHPDLLVSDHLMPGLSGTDLAVRLRARLPSLPVLIVSGYAESDALAPAFPRLTKPFRQADLAAAIGAIRGEAPPPSAPAASG